MTKDQLDKLSKAAIEINAISAILAEGDDDVPHVFLAILTGVAGSFTTLVHIADMIEKLGREKPGLIPKGFLQ